jgi:hypothetical protein
MGQKEGNEVRKKALVLIAATALIAALASPVTAADGDGGTGAVTAAVGESSGIFGTRSVTSVTPTIGLILSPGTSNMTGTVAIVVTEAARTGTASWSVTAILDEISPVGSGNGFTDGASPVTFIPRSAASINAATPTIVAGGGSAALGSSGNLSAARTLYTVTGQSTSLNYTGTYTSSHTVTLAVPNVQKTGVYTGTLRVALVQ